MAAYIGRHCRSRANRHMTDGTTVLLSYTNNEIRNAECFCGYHQETMHEHLDYFELSIWGWGHPTWVLSSESARSARPIASQQASTPSHTRPQDAEERDRPNTDQSDLRSQSRPAVSPAHAGSIELHRSKHSRPDIQIATSTAAESHPRSRGDGFLSARQARAADCVPSCTNAREASPTKRKRTPALEVYLVASII